MLSLWWSLASFGCGVQTFHHYPFCKHFISYWHVWFYVAWSSAEIGLDWEQHCIFTATRLYKSISDVDHDWWMIKSMVSRETIELTRGSIKWKCFTTMIVDVRWMKHAIRISGRKEHFRDWCQSSQYYLLPKFWYGRAIKTIIFLIGAN